MDVADVTDATPGNAEAGPSRPQIAAQPSIDLTGESDDDDEKSHHPTSGSGATHSSPTTSMNHGPKPHQNGYSNSNTNGHYNGNGHASTSHHYSPLYNFPAHPTQPVPNSCYGNPYTFGTPAYSPPPYNGMMGNGYPGYVSSPYASSSSHMIHPPPTPGGGTSQSAIDLTSAPSPPQRNPKQPVCIGAITTQAYMLYPSPVVVLGGVSDKEKLDLIPYRGAEFLKVKLKYRQAGAVPRKSDVWTTPKTDVIQVMTPALTHYIGDLDAVVSDILISHMSRGLLRLEGFALRLHPDSPMYQLRLNILLFTLPANIKYISETLLVNNIYLDEPFPPYDPNRHSDRPPYENPHGERNAERLARARFGQNQQIYPQIQMERVNQVEVQRRQVDEVFQSIESGGELDQSDPGPLIKTMLFPHQRKALTFLLQREQDASCLKRARKYADKAMKKAQASGEEVEEKSKIAENHRSLWDGQKDEKGRVRIWKNKITGDTVRTKKGERPPECKGAILADDMGLGKTLSMISLIAATRRSALKWSHSEPETVEQETMGDTKLEIEPSEIMTKVFGMPEVEVKPMKRKREEVKRLLTRTKGTLLVCPMSTITNWEDQIKEHWDGDVEVVGGASGVLPKPTVKKWKPPKKDGEDDSDMEDEFDKLRIYIYHGPSRIPDPSFIAEFDIVITSYNTLALEFRRQGGGGDDTPTETATNSDEDFGDTSLNPRAVKPEVEAEIKAAEVSSALLKRKKGKMVEKSPLQSLDWFRVVLDEAHYIKTASTVASTATCQLSADRRIALTGTPIQNKIEDVWALFKFLKLSPIDEREMFTKYISSLCKAGDQVGVARLQLVMKCCTLRRTKDSTAEDGRRILNLPPRKEIQVWLDLREDEREAYNLRKGEAKKFAEELKDNKEITNAYATMLQEILRLRQTCDHVDLVNSGAVEEDYDGTIMDYEVAVQGINMHGLNQARAVSVMCFMKEGDQAQCVGCNYDFSDFFPTMGLAGVEDVKPKKKLTIPVILTKCLHVFCVKCFKAQVYSGLSKKTKDVARECSACSSMLRLPADIHSISSVDNDEVDEKPSKVVRRKYVRPPGEKPNLSTKMQYLYDQLMTASRRNINSYNYDEHFVATGDGDDVEEMDADGRPYKVKSVVFSQWTTMLDRIGDMLEEAHIAYARLDGTMTREERAKACDALKYDKKVEVLLVSTRAGGVGLNLTAASRCFLVDPYWNPSVEAQAIDRIHRMGQTRPVTAIKLMINDSIEMKLDEMQKKKASLANLSLNKLSRKELLARKADELAMLFS